MTVSIIGLGLIGGSFAKAIKKYTECRVLGFDRSEDVLLKAYECGAIDDVCTNFSDTDVALIALFPEATLKFLKETARGFAPGATVIDLCGVKRCICDSLRGIFPEGVNFIGGHPMAGREFAGFENSTAELFQSASMVLTPDDDIILEKLEGICEFFQQIGFSHVEITDEKSHDKLIAYTSQLPHIISSAYIQNPLVRKKFGFTAGSFLDMTRVARLNEEMWTELFLHNSDFLQEQIQVTISNLTAFCELLAEHDESGLREMLRDGRMIKESLDEEEFV